ncbi:hypothetical protein BDF14DRAFT_1734961 [Spinellus fusiger]|nr:hypothetical protein BDF14DRAFT_1734961 [Spinellus fusiger]
MSLQPEAETGTTSSSALLTERTPLLPTQARTTESTKPPQPLPIYKTLFACLAVFVLVLSFVREKLPDPLSDTDARHSLDVFSGLHSYNEYLSKFNTPHSANQRGNAVIKDWLVDLVVDFQVQGRRKGLRVDVVTNDTTPLVYNKNRFAKNEYWSVESRNVLLRLVGQNNNTEQALLVNAHYDSVSTSHGVTDNGMGVAVAIELIRYFIAHPPRHTIVFLFNNFEEPGLVGAEQFIRHPWWKTIKLFLNLEGTGAGGRALLFRANNLKAVSALATSRFVHGSTMGSDMLQAGLLKSDTDYTVFTANGVPGLDLSFYTPRAYYHTSRDDLVHTTPNALQHMGQMALSTLRSIDVQENEHDPLSPDNAKIENFIFYDILGRVMLAYSFTTAQAVNVAGLLIVPLLAILASFLRVRTMDTAEEKWHAVRNEVLVAFKGFAAALLAMSVMFLLVVVVSGALLLWSPSATYGNAYGVTFLIVLTALLGLLISQLIFSHLASRHASLAPMTQFDVQLQGLTLFWWEVLFVAAILTGKGYAGIYPAIFFLISSASATALYHRFAANKYSNRLFAVFAVQLLMPVTLMVDLCMLGVDSMRHTTADGTPEVTVYVLIAVPVLIIALHLLPWVQTVHCKTEMVRYLAILLVLLFFITTSLSPFNEQYSPNRILFNQEYNATESLSTVSLITGSTTIQSTLEEALTGDELRTLQCGPNPLSYQTRCTYQTERVPMYAAQPHEINITHTSTCDDALCQATITAQVKNSLLCQLKFSHANSTVKAWINSLPVINNQAERPDTIGSLVAYKNDERKPMVWQLEYPHSLSLSPLVSCIYDDWTEGEMPAYSTLRNRLSGSSFLTMRGGIGLAMVHYYPHLPL